MKVVQRRLAQRRGVRSTGPPRRYGVRRSVVEWPRLASGPFGSLSPNVIAALRGNRAEAAAITWENWGEIIRLHDGADYSGTPSHFFEAVLEVLTGTVIRARLFNVTANAAVAGSTVGTNAATATRVRSGNFNVAAGDNEYRAQIGS